MKKLLILTAVTLVSMTSMAGPAVKVTVTPEKDMPSFRMPSVSTGNVIVDENFEGFVKGSEDAPDWSTMLCSHYSDEKIPSELTHGQQWTGHNVYMAGGSAALFDINPMDPAYIRTPQMDYSGSITLSFRVKALFTEWEDDEELDDNGNPVKWHFTSSTLMLFLANERELEFNLGDYQLGNEPIYVTPVFPDQGWCEVKVEFDNYSAYNDAFFQITSGGHMLVGDIKVFTSADKFLASPVFSGFTAATDDSFTVSWERVSKASNYYLYLYELTGTDENGNPIYKTVIPLENFFTDEQQEQIAEMGMTLEEYIAYMAEMYGVTVEELMDMLVNEEPYNNCGNVDQKPGVKNYTYTYSHLDKEKQYYFDIRSQFYMTFSPKHIMPVNAIGSPKNLPATDINESGFTANWSKITKAEQYSVDLYGVQKVEKDEDFFIIFEEDFKATEELTDATDITNPDVVPEGSDICFDDLTSSPGWSFPSEQILLVNGKVGLGVDEWGGSSRLTSPVMYVGGADRATIAILVESTISNYEIRLRFAGQLYYVNVEGSSGEIEIELPTFGLKETNLSIIGPDEAPIFIDYISVSQPLKAGSYTFTWLGRDMVNGDINSKTYYNLDLDRFPYYAYSVLAYRIQDGETLISIPSERMIVDLKAGSSESQFAGIATVESPKFEVARYSLDGRLLSAPASGINIIRYSDGSVRKVMVK